MYNVFQIMNGVTALIEQYRDFNAAKEYAVALSRIKNAVYYIVRDSGLPLVYLYRGEATVDAPAIMAKLTSDDTAPVLTLEPPAPEDDVPDEPPGLQEPVQHHPRRRKAGPKETKAAPAGPTEHKAFPATVTDVNEAEGVVTAIVSVFGIVDDGDDIIHPNSFIKTLAERGHRIRVLNSHNMRSALDAIGKVVSIREVGRDELPANILARYPEATGGLETVTQYMLDDEISSAIFRRIKAGVLSEYSIGFDIVQAKNEKMELPDGKSKVVRNIREVRLWEYSPVVFGMNPATSSVSVKGIADEQKDVDAADVPDEQSTPLLADWLVTDIMQHCQVMLGGMKWFGLIDETEHDMLMQLCNERIERIKTDMPLGLALRPLDNGGMMMMAGDGADEFKAGRVLSEANYSKIRQATDLLNQVIESAGRADDTMTQDKSIDGMEIVIPSIPDQQLTTGPHDEPEKAPTSEKMTEAGPRGEDAPTERRAELEARLSRLLVED